jgi:hypothetical protein
MRAGSNRANPFSSTRDDPAESFSEEEESDLDLDISSPSGSPELASANHGRGEGHLLSSHRDGPLDQLKRHSRLRC